MRQDAELKKNEATQLEERIKNIKTVIVSGAISAKDRETLLEQFKKLQSRQTTLENDIRELTLAVAKRQHEYDILDASHNFY